MIAPYPDPDSAYVYAVKGSDATRSGPGWTSQGEGYESASETSTSTSAGAAYDFTGLTAGQEYEVLASWVPGTNNTSAATYTISGAASQSVSVDQRTAPLADQSLGDVNWQVLLTFKASGTSATVTLGGADGTHALVADGVQIASVGPVTSSTYDGAGNTLTDTDTAGAVTAYVYDNLNRETSVSLPDPANGTQDTYSPVTSYAYDLAGNLTSTTSPSPTGSGTVTSYNTYDLQNNLLTSTDANDGVTSYTHNALGEVLSLTDPDSNTTTWTLDHLGQTISQSAFVALGYNTDGTVNTTTATSYDFYDPAGNLVNSMDADYRTIAYAYDHLFQETGETWYDPSGTQVGAVAYGYNPAGYMTSASNGTGSSSSTNVASYAYQYSTTGNVQVENVSLAGVSKTVTLASVYDYNNDRTTLAANINEGGVTPTFNSDGTVSFSGGTNDFLSTYSYNTLGDMTGIVQTDQPTGTYNGVAPKTVTFGYDAAERMTSVNRYATDDPGSLGPSTLVAGATYSYDHASQLTGLTYADGATSTIAAYHWDYNDSGAVTDFYSRSDFQRRHAGYELYRQRLGLGSRNLRLRPDRAVDEHDLRQLQRRADDRQ